MGRIVHMDADIPSIFMPIGKVEDGGTCAFATDKCMEYCPSGMVVNEHEKYTLELFKLGSHNFLINKIKDDFAFLANRPYNAKMLQWFVWGDCLPELTDKIAFIIIALFKSGFSQYGFTRNRKLWNMIPNHDRLHIGLTLDSFEEAIKLSEGSDKMVASPDVKAGYAQMVYRGKLRSRCSGWWCVTEKGETRNSDCTQCSVQGEGCYFREDGV